MPNVTFRGAAADDVQWLYELHRDALGGYIEQTWGWDEDAQADFFRRNHDPKLRQVIQIDGRDAGFLDVERLPDCMVLRNIEIHPRFQGQGAGSQIIRQLLAEAAALGVPLRLQVLKVNRRAKALYERLGFRVCDENQTHFQMEASGAGV